MSILRRAKKALEGVTPGPWAWDGRRAIDGAGYAEVLYPGLVDCMSYCYGGSSTIEGDNLDVDMRFIAEARILVPQLIDACESWVDVAITRQDLIDQLKAEKRALQYEVDRLTRVGRI